MSTLLSEFIHHFTSTEKGGKLRQLIDESWDTIPRNNEIQALKSYLFDKGVGVDFLNSTVAPQLNSSTFHVKFAGVFCHKKPTTQRTAASIAANPGDTPGCELGDLLTLFVLLDSANKLHHLSGSLFQAKVKPKLDSLSQRHLYDNDLEFKLPANLGAHTRRMPTFDEGRGRALRYLILNPDSPNKYVSCRHTPWGADYQHRWSTYIYNLLAGNEGLPARLANSKSQTSWEIIVDDLLGVAAKVPKQKPARGTDIAVKIATAQFNSFLSSEVQCIQTEEPGISILMIIAHKHIES